MTDPKALSIHADVMARMIQTWLDWQEREYGPGLSDDVAFYSVPVWPNRGTFKAWHASLVELEKLAQDAGRRAERTPDDDVHELYLDALGEADRAARKFPQPNYTITKIAEEAGEVVKAAIHCAEGRGSKEEVIAEIRQAMAMLIRLYREGDQVHGLLPLAPSASPDPAFSPEAHADGSVEYYAGDQWSASASARNGLCQGTEINRMRAAVLDVAAIVRRLDAAEAKVKHLSEALDEIADFDDPNGALDPNTVRLVRIAGAARRGALKEAGNG